MTLMVCLYLNVITLTAVYKQMWKNDYVVGQVLFLCSVALRLTSLFNYRLKGFAEGRSNSVVALRMGKVVVVKLILKTGGRGI